MSNLSNKTIENTYKSVLNIGTDSNPNGVLTPTLSTVTDGFGNNSSLSITSQGNGAKVTGPLSVEGDVFIGTDKFLQFGGTSENTDTTRIQRVNNAFNETELRVIVGDDRHSNGNDTFVVGGWDSTSSGVFRPVLTVSTGGALHLTPQPLGASQDVLTVPARSGTLVPGWPVSWGGGIRTWDIRFMSASGVNVYCDNLIFPNGTIQTSSNQIVWLETPVIITPVNNNTWTRSVIFAGGGLKNVKTVIIQVSQGRIQTTDGTTTQVYFKSTSSSALEFTAMLHFSNDGNRNSAYTGQGHYPVSFDGDVVIYTRHTRNGNFGTPIISVMGYIN